jgi:lysophospholipase L1-like esterase
MAGHARSLSALKQDLCRLAQTAETQSDQVLLIAPPRILDSVDPDWGFPADAPQTSLGMTGVCRQAADACGCRFLDGSQLEVDRRDGLHLSPAGHEALAMKKAALLVLVRSLIHRTRIQQYDISDQTHITKKTSPLIAGDVFPCFGFPADAPQTSLGMTGICRQAADACGCRFLDGSQLEVDRRDGLHLSQAGHEALATAVADLIRQQ